MKTGQGVGRRRWIWIVGGIFVLLALACVLLVAAFPFGMFKDSIERRIGDSLGTRISIGSIERREALSFTPTILINNLTVRQPQWAGQGDMVRARRIEARLPILSALMGRGVKPEGLIAHGLVLALVRDAEGRANWEGPKRTDGDSGKGSGLDGLLIPDGRLSLRDDKRYLNVAGSFVSDARGFRIDGRGHFHAAPAQLSIRGGAIAGLAPDASYPLTLSLVSPLLNLEARGTTMGALNTRAMTLDMHAVAPSLKYVDDVIEAGLFGTQPVDLRARVRHVGRDWFVDRMTGRIGRSNMVAKAVVLKRDGRTKIDADMHFRQFGFDDLADARGKAEGDAVEARTGKRVLPATRINLMKIGPTDGVIRFRADRLLLDKSAFRSLRGTISLEGKLLRITDIVAGMSSGRMTGSLQVDQRDGMPKPRLSIDLAFKDGRLETLIGTHAATGPLRGRVLLAGTGDTIREALGHADGRAGMLVQAGTVNKTLAAVLGQDLGKAIGAAIGDREAEVPLRCLAIGFAAKSGVLTPSPFVADTSISIGQGQGRIALATESIALTLRGRSRDPSGLALVDPIIVGGTLYAPTVSAGGAPPGSKVEAKSVLKAIGKSLGQALGIGKDKRPEGPAMPEAVDCNALARRVL